MNVSQEPPFIDTSRGHAYAGDTSHDREEDNIFGDVDPMEFAAKDVAAGRLIGKDDLEREFGDAAQ